MCSELICVITVRCNGALPMRLFTRPQCNESFVRLSIWPAFELMKGQDLVSKAAEIIWFNLRTSGHVPDWRVPAPMCQKWPQKLRIKCPKRDIFFTAKEGRQDGEDIKWRLKQGRKKACKKNKIKLRVKYMHLTKHHAMKTYWGVGV